MKNKQLYFRKASFTTLLLVILGYTVKFYPQQVTGFDSAIQNTLRGNLPALATKFWTGVTYLGEPVILLGITLICSGIFYLKKWKAESYLLLVSYLAVVVGSTALKYVYQRPRPTLEWLMGTSGYSFPSWHTASTMMIAGAVVIVIQQRVKHPAAKRLLQIGVLLPAVLTALSRIYIGVHFPTDIIGGWLLSLALLFLIYPFYDEIRFTWRFQSKQK